MILLLVILYLAMVFVILVKPKHSSLSLFELERRAEKKDKIATEMLRREQLLPNVIVVKNFLIIVLGLIFVGYSISKFGVVPGLLLSGLAAMSLGPIVRLRTLVGLANDLYRKIEEGLLDFVEKFSGVFGFFRDISGDFVNSCWVSSREELEHVVASAVPEIISEDEETIMMSAIKFRDKTVADVMIEKEKITYIHKDELLTPSALDQLHRTSYSHFPVVGEDIDHVEGVLRAKAVLEITRRESPKASSVMEKRVYFVREDHSLEYALNAFVRTGYCFFVVINEARETVGILTLRDLMESLLGKKMNDEFDKDDDRVAVAGRKPKNNSTKFGVDL